MTTTKPVRLGDGTQEIEMRQVPTALCRCGRNLTWTIDVDTDEYRPIAECDCGMSYYAWPATVKIEGTCHDPD